MATVLVADDKYVNRELLVTLLAYGGHRLLEAADGAEALAQVKTQHPDLVITDVLMPVMDGYEFVRQVRNDPQIAATQVIFYTASYHEREARALAESCGVRHLIFKPAEPEQILATVSEALGMVKPQEETHPSSEFDREHLRLLTDKLSANMNALEATNQRLSELLEASRVLAAEHDADGLLDKFCPVAREIVGARFAFIGVFSEDGRTLKPLFVSGIDALRAADLALVGANEGVLARLLSASEPLSVPDVSGDPLEAGLPMTHGATRSFLGIPLRNSNGPYGLLWLLEKLGGAGFVREDERVLISLVAQAGVAYENAQRYREIQRHADQLEVRVDERTAKLTEANRDLEAFAYTASHDLRAPLTVIRGFSALLEENSAIALDEKSRKQLAKIDESAAKMATLIDELLRFSRASLEEVAWSIVDLGVMVDNVICDFELECRGRDIVWTRGELPKVRGDAAMLRQVFVNLLANALKYTRPRARVEIEIGATQNADGFEFFVRDNGVGFDQADADKLFAVFQRLHRDDEFEGTGIGLANIRRIVSSHKGKTWAEGRMGEGATFYFSLPKLQSMTAKVAR